MRFLQAAGSGSERDRQSLAIVRTCFEVLSGVPGRTCSEESLLDGSPCFRRRRLRTLVCRLADVEPARGDVFGAARTVPECQSKARTKRPRQRFAMQYKYSAVRMNNWLPACAGDARV